MCLIPCSLFRGARFFIKNVTPGFYIALSECFVRELHILHKCFFGRKRSWGLLLPYPLILIPNYFDDTENTKDVGTP